MIWPMPEPRLHLSTCEEFNRLAESGAFEGLAIELIDGAVIDRCPLGSPHGAIVSHLDRLLNRFYHESTGLCVRCQLPLTLDNDTQTQADIAVVCGSPLDYYRRTPEAATLVIEVAKSSPALDRGIKAERYSLASILEYWILNLQDEQLEVYRRPSSKVGFATPVVMNRNHQIVLPGLHNVVLPVADLLP